MHFGGTVDAPASEEEIARGHKYSKGVRQYLVANFASTLTSVPIQGHCFAVAVSVYMYLA